MPELPEVETIVREIRPSLRGRAILGVVVRKADVLRGVSPAALRRALLGRRIVSVARRAKHAVLTLDSGSRLVIQPGMTGSLLVHRRPLNPDHRRYAVLLLDLEEAVRVVYRDVRRLGRIWLLDRAGWAAYTARVGPEPLASVFTAAALAAQLRGTRQAVKKALMDQHRVAGVGNIYANEALYRARIDPSRRADRLTAVEIARLWRAVRAVLREAVAARGSTIRDYRTGTGQRGRFQFALRVYGRGGEACLRCGRRLVTTHAVDGRATTFCVTCQGARSV